MLPESSMMNRMFGCAVFTPFAAPRKSSVSSADAGTVARHADNAPTPAQTKRLIVVCIRLSIRAHERRAVHVLGLEVDVQHDHRARVRALRFADVGHSGHEIRGRDGLAAH